MSGCFTQTAETPHQTSCYFLALLWVIIWLENENHSSEKCWFWLVAGEVKLLYWPTGCYLFIVYLFLQNLIKASKARD